MEPLKVVAYPKEAANPYINLLYKAVEKQGVSVEDGNWIVVRTGAYDIVHYHWPESFLNSPSLRWRLRGFGRFILTTLTIKQRGKSIVWTMHNAEAHEETGKLLPWLFRKILFYVTDGVIALSKTSYQSMITQYPQLAHKPFLLSWIGDYRELYPEIPTKSSAKHRLGISSQQFVIGFFGAIRKYKNLPHLLQVFSQLAEKDLVLLVTGRSNDPLLEKELRELANLDHRIKLQILFVPEAEIPWILRSVDLMVLPFLSLLNSSSALLSLSFDVPLLAPAIGSLIELEQAVGREWVRLYDDVLTPEILREAITWARAVRAERAPLKCYNWSECGAQTVEFYHRIAGYG